MIREPERLFSYGTLQSEDVQLTTFGRTLEGEPDSLAGYVITMVLDRQAPPETYHRNIEFTGKPSDVVSGIVLHVTPAELEQADVYEQDAEYKRIQVKTESGKDVWVYRHAAKRDGAQCMNISPVAE